MPIGLVIQCNSAEPSLLLSLLPLAQPVGPVPFPMAASRCLLAAPAWNPGAGRLFACIHAWLTPPDAKPASRLALRQQLYCGGDDGDRAAQHQIADAGRAQTASRPNWFRAARRGRHSLRHLAAPAEARWARGRGRKGVMIAEARARTRPSHKDRRWQGSAQG